MASQPGCVNREETGLQHTRRGSDSFSAQVLIHYFLSINALNVKYEVNTLRMKSGIGTVRSDFKVDLGN